MKAAFTSAAPAITHVVVTDEFAGVERYLCEVAPRQADRGHRVRVLGGDESSMRAGLGPDVAWRPAPSVATAALALAKREEFRSDIVHTHMSNADVAAVLTKPLTRSAIVSTRHFAAPRGSRPGVRAVLGLAARGIDAEVAISRFVAQQTGEDLRVVVNGVASQPSSARVRDKTVLVMQRLEREKDTATALRAFAAAGLAETGWRLCIAGRGAERQALEALVSTLQLTACVEWLGFVTDPGALQARVAVHLASATAEPFGLAVAESMARGTPVVASFGGAHPELLGPDGWLFAPGDANGAAAQLRRVLDDGAAAAYGSSLRARQRAAFEIERHVSDLCAIYTEVLR